MNNAFDGIISRLDMDKERISEVEDMQIKTSKTSKRREEKNERKTKYAITVEQLQKAYQIRNDNTRRRKRKRSTRNVQSNNT